MVRISLTVSQSSISQCRPFTAVAMYLATDWIWKGGLLPSSPIHHGFQTWTNRAIELHLNASNESSSLSDCQLQRPGYEVQDTRVRDA